MHKGSTNFPRSGSSPLGAPVTESPDPPCIPAVLCSLFSVLCLVTPSPKVRNSHTTPYIDVIAVSR
eukprot:1176780-Pyramimonas_sp.AAC.1